MRRRSQVLLVLGVWGATAAANAQALHVLTFAQHAHCLPGLRALVAGCQADAARCAAGKDIADETFPLPNGVQTHVDYAWLRNGLGTLAKIKPEDKGKAANILLARLNADSTDLPPSTVSAARARTEADRVLAEVEFAKSKPSLLQQQWDRFTDWLGKHLSARGTLGEAGPWLRVLLEVALFAVPLLLLGLWLLRQVREDRLRPSSSPQDPAGTASRPTSWADIAQLHARNGEWRDAVHALYWQAITGFEQRRIWSAARHRTPREYLRLLEPGSPRRSLLRELTVLLERVWYGHADATEADFDRARRLAEELAAA